MLMGARLPLKFWQLACEAVCYIRNRTPVGPEGKTPDEAFIGRKPTVAHLRAWGCLAIATLPKENRDNKLSAAAL
jgi:hypothetical protein